MSLTMRQIARMYVLRECPHCHWWPIPVRRPEITCQRCGWRVTHGELRAMVEGDGV